VRVRAYACVRARAWGACFVARKEEREGACVRVCAWVRKECACVCVRMRARAIVVVGIPGGRRGLRRAPSLRLRCGPAGREVSAIDKEGLAVCDTLCKIYIIYTYIYTYYICIYSHIYIHTYVLLYMREYRRE
jgi:hypothetical protein